MGLFLAAWAMGGNPVQGVSVGSLHGCPDPFVTNVDVLSSDD